MSNVLLIFIKNPRPGYVKTRLAKTVGDKEALRIYHVLLEKTRRAALDTSAQRWLCYSDQVEFDDEWPEQHFQKFVQQGNDLGARMEHAFQQAFAAGASKVTIIGSDCPELSGALINESLAALDHADFVLGPTLDGGYYLLGMRFFEPSLFRDIIWSTETVRQETLKKIQAAGKTCFLLPELIDVDTEADWRRVNKTTTFQSP